MRWFFVFIALSALTLQASELPVPRERENRSNARPRCGDELLAVMKNRNSMKGSIEDYLERRAILEASLPAYSRTAETILFQYERPGLNLSFETGPYSGSHMSGVTLTKFDLVYDPTWFTRLSVIRRTLGNEPRVLTEKDLRYSWQSMLMGDEGTVMELYIKGHSGVRDPEEQGGIIMVNRDNGLLRFYEPGTDVSAQGEGILRGSGKAVWDFAKGLAGEFECARYQYTGTWTADPQVIDGRLAPENLPPTNPPQLGN